MNGLRQASWMPAAFAAVGLAVVVCGCQGPQNVAPEWSWTPGSGAKISPPQTGRGAYGSPDPYYQNAPRGNSSIDRSEGDESFARRDTDDRLEDREYSVSPATYQREEDPLKFKGMPKSGEPQRFNADRNLVELTDLPESRFGLRAPRSAATIMTPNSRTKRTPYRAVDRGDDERGYDEDYRAASRTADGRWRRRE